MDGGKVVQLSLLEFTDTLLPVPRELVDARCPSGKVARLTEGLTDMAEHYVVRGWANGRVEHPEVQLAHEFTQIVNKHVFEYVTETEKGSTASTTAIGGACAVGAGSGGASGGDGQLEGTSSSPRYLMKVFPHRWDGSDEEGGIWSAAALFRREWQPELEADQPNWAYQSAFVQFTPEGAHNDPFDVCSLVDLEEIADDLLTDSRAHIQEQMRSYADSIALYQHRTAVFSFVAGPREFRVMCWDHSGVFVSERVDYVRDTRALVEVLLALVAADREGLGSDPTATLLLKGSKDYEVMDRIVDETSRRLPVLPWVEGTPLPPTVATMFPSDAVPPADANVDGYLVNDAQHDTSSHCEDDSSPTEMAATTHRVLKDGSFVFQYVLDSFRSSLANGSPRYKLVLGSDEFLVGAPLYHDIRPGGTRGYVAFHKQSGRFVLLKDSWRRPQYPGGAVTSEGDVLRKLNEDGVRNVPTLLCHGVVDGQVTRVLECWTDKEERRWEEERLKDSEDKDIHKDGEFKDETRGVKRTRDDMEEEAISQTRHYVHYRIALREVYLPLAAFTSSRQLVSVVGDCIEAHHEAMEKSKLIHCDVSSESIVILPTFVQSEDDGDNPTLRVVWRGLLTDWEFAKSIPGHGEDQSARQPEKSMVRYRQTSSELHPAHTPGIADELESFFNVLLHLALRFCPHNFYTPQIIYKSFLDSVGPYMGDFCPSTRRLMIAEYGELMAITSKLVFGRPGRPNEPLNRLFRMMLGCFNARYKILEREHETMTAQATSTVPGPPARRQRVGPDLVPPEDALPLAEVHELVDRDVDPSRPPDAVHKLACFLQTHDAVRDLFRETKSRVWPEDGVVEDRLSFPVLLREAQAARSPWVPMGSYWSASRLLPRGLIVAARRALPQRRIVR
ncbi:hypothetical protein V8D89_010995 [Ganoderma adspersum]